MRKLQFKRGLRANLPQLDVGEPAYVTDEKKLYVGNGDANIPLATPYSGTATLAVANWIGSAAPYTYTIAVAGMLDTDNPQIGVVLSHTDVAADDLLQKEWAKAVGNGAKATAGQITLYAKEKPTVAIPMFWRGSR